MPRVAVKRSCPVLRTAKLVQLQGLFDLQESEKSEAQWTIDAPLEERDWNVGLIVGPSGCGKTTVARELFRDSFVDGYEWHADRSVVDCFGSTISETAAILSSVGFSSPPDWMKPFRVLSNGQQFRCTLARALEDPRPVVCMDEFTSVVDRNVAKIGSHAVAKAVRTRKRKFVAVSCHDDIVDWLQPDWVIEPHFERFSWRLVQRRPPIELRFKRCKTDDWQMFAHHHYLTASIHRAAKCWLVYVNGALAAFCSTLHYPNAHHKNLTRMHRMVVLPDYQGIGLGIHIPRVIASIAVANGRRVHAGTTHPALARMLAKSQDWDLLRKPEIASEQRGLTHIKRQFRRVANFHYVGPAHSDPEEASALWQ